MDYWNMDAEAVVDALASDANSGITGTAAQKRLQEFGANKLVQEMNLTFLTVFEEEMRGVDAFSRRQREIQPVRVKR